MTFEWLTDPAKIGDVSAISGSYYSPLGEKWGVTGYGGLSKSELQDVIPALDITGEGWYVGVQFSRKLRESDDYDLDLSLGWMFQESQNVNRLSDGVVVADRTVQLSMPRITLGYASKGYDRLGGRNYWNNTLLFNFSGQFGSSSEAAARAQNPGAQADIVLDRFSFARFQKLGGGEGYGVLILGTLGDDIDGLV